MPAGARFCAQCGVPLVAGARPASDWRLTGTGASVLGFFLIAGLAIWTGILSPAPPKPVPGATATSAGAPAGAVPEGHPQGPVELPADVKSFIADMQAKAEQEPHDVAAWVKLGRVTARAAQLDPTYYSSAIAAFEHVIQLEPRNAEGLRDLAHLHYDRSEHQEAIPLFERYLAIRPDDPAARTDLGTMYLFAGNGERAIATYRDVIHRSPSYLQAYYNLAIAYHRQGNDAEALTQLKTARGLATQDDARQQIDDLIAALTGGTPNEGGTASATKGSAATPPPSSAARSPFQQAVEESFRGHPIMGPRIVRFDWTSPTSGRVVVQNFPMDGMPAAVREKFTTHLAEMLGTAADAHPTTTPVQMEITDTASGTVMATVTGSPRGEGATASAAKGSAAAPPAAGAPRSPFQQAVEESFRGHPIMGPRIVRFDWSSPTSGRVVVQNFPMEGMPAAVREKFTTHLAEMLRTAAGAHPTTGPVQMEVADAASGTVMATVAP